MFNFRNQAPGFVLHLYMQTPAVLVFLLQKTVDYISDSFDVPHVSLAVAMHFTTTIPTALAFLKCVLVVLVHEAKIDR